MWYFLHNFQVSDLSIYLVAFRENYTTQELCCRVSCKLSLLPVLAYDKKTSTKNHLEEILS